MGKEFWKFRNYYNFGTSRRPEFHIPWSQSMWDSRWRRDDFPIYEFHLESINHYFRFKTKLRPEHENLEAARLISKKFREFTGLQVIFIRRTTPKMIREYVYREKPKDLINDGSYNFHIDWIFNARDRFFLPFFVEHQFNKDFEKSFLRFLVDTFLDTRGRPLKERYQILETGTDKLKYRKKRRQHIRYRVPHKESQDSPIEELFEQGLSSRNIKFRKQVEIAADGKLFTIPDFLIEEPLIAIYCDGTEFHKDPDKIIRDKQQDRLLQRIGYKVFRFSGSEILSNLDDCITEITYETEKEKYLKKGIDPIQQGWWFL